MFEELLTLDGLVSLLALTALEVVLGIDNIIFVSIVAGRLPKSKQKLATNIGLLAATGIRIALLFVIKWIIGLQDDLFVLFGMGFSGKDMILMAGGLFLIAKSTSEIHEKLEGEEERSAASLKAAVNSFTFIVVQIVFINLIFSFDSILTAIGMSKNIVIMMIAVVLSVIVMILFISKINDFVNRHPTIKMLALSFLILIGVLLVAEGFGQEISKTYIYFAMTFSLSVELLNMRLRKKHTAATEHSHAPLTQEKSEEKQVKGETLIKKI